MKQWMTAATVAGLVLAGQAWAGGEGCTYGKKTGSTASGKSCTYDATASAGKTCGEMKAGDCKSCDELAASGKALKATGANFEVVKTKGGYIVIATATGTDNIAALRKANAERWTSYVSHVKADPKHCKSCTGFSAGLKSGDVALEQVELVNGVMTIFTAANDDACAALKASCGAFCGLKTAEAKIEKTTATN